MDAHAQHIYDAGVRAGAARFASYLIHTADLDAATLLAVLRAMAEFDPHRPRPFPTNPATLISQGAVQ